MKWHPLKLFSLISASILMLTSCNLFPKPESLIQVPQQVKAGSKQEETFVSIAQRNLPKGTELSVPNGPVGAEPVISADLDGDGQEEILVLYRSVNNRNQVGAFVLKKTKKNWEKVFAKKGTGSEISWASVVDVTGDGHSEILLGWQSGASAGNMLEVYSWDQGRLTMIDQRQFHELEAIQFENDPKTRLAIWSRDLADVYNINLLVWDGNSLVPDSNHYPSYFQKVIDYYNHRTFEVPDAAYYWYYLADAYLRADHPELAIGAVNTGMNLKTVVPSIDHFQQLKKQIEAKNEASKNSPVRFERWDPDITFEVKRELAPYISTKDEQGSSNNFILTVELSPDKKKKESLFSIEVYPKDMTDHVSDSELDKIGETEGYIYFVKRSKHPRELINDARFNLQGDREQIISSIKLGAVHPKYKSFEEQEVIKLLKEATNKYWYVVRGGKIPEGEIKAIVINDTDFRYMGADLDTTTKLNAYLADIYTEEAIQSFKNKARIFEYFGKLVQPNADGGSLLNYDLAKVIQKKDNGYEKEFDVKVPLGNSYIYDTVHIGFQKTDSGWRIFSEPGNF